MQWHANLECGIPSIDEEHKELFLQVNRLLKAADENMAIETLNFLGNYVRKHFANEEVMHRQTGYPDTEKHVRLHRDFTRALAELRREYAESGHSLVMLLKINRAAVAWLQEHVLGADREFADFYKQRACPLVR